MAVVLPALLLVAACGGEEGPPRTASGVAGERGEASGAVRITDDAGRPVVLPRPPERVVSLVPSATEILLALDASDRLVGRTDYDTVPPLDTLPSVGGGLHPSLERLISLRPDLVIRFAGASDRETPRRLDALEIPHLAVRPDGIPDVRGMIRTLGRVVGRRVAADSLLAAMDSTLADVASRVRHRPPRRVAFVLGGSPPWVAGPGTFVDQLLTLAGGENVFSDLGELYGPVSPETFVARPLELILAVEGAEVELPMDDVPLRRVSPEIQTPGPDLGRAALELARILHPEAFP